LRVIAAVSQPDARLAVQVLGYGPPRDLTAARRLFTGAL
jgi:hypothetical protein